MVSNYTFCLFLSFCFSCFVLGELIPGPGGALFDPACFVELPHGATVYGTERIELADGTAVPYPRCTSNATSSGKREANGWNELAYFDGGFLIDQLNGDWVVPPRPGMGNRGQIVYLFTGLQPASGSIILQPVLWYGVSPAGGGDGWYVAVWQISDGSGTVTPVVQVSQGQTLHTTMIRYPENGVWSCLIYVDGVQVTGGNFANIDHVEAFVALELYNAPDCWVLPNQMTTNFFNFQIHQLGGNYVTPVWTGLIEQTDCGQAVVCIGSTCGLSYGLPAVLNPLVFDVNTYIALNTDLHYSTALDYQNHWQNYGVNDGRIAAEYFFVAEYKAIYSDLAPLSNVDAITHYATSGYLEGRIGRTVLHPLAFDYDYYYNTYADLRSAYGANNKLAYYNHWVVYGIYEGRQAISTFWAPQYLSMYSDLQAAYGTNYYAATQHWVLYGHAEGRLGISS